MSVDELARKRAVREGGRGRERKGVVKDERGGSKAKGEIFRKHFRSIVRVEEFLRVKGEGVGRKLG